MKNAADENYQDGNATVWQNEVKKKVRLSPKILPLGSLNDDLKKLKEENKNT